MNKTTTAVFCLILAGSTAAVGCSKKTTREDVKAELTKSGIPADKADCVTDKMIARFGLERMSQRSDLTAEENEAAKQIGVECSQVGAPTTVAATAETTAVPTSAP